MRTPAQASSAGNGTPSVTSGSHAPGAGTSISQASFYTQGVTKGSFYEGARERAEAKASKAKAPIVSASEKGVVDKVRRTPARTRTHTRARACGHARPCA